MRGIIQLNIFIVCWIWDSHSGGYEISVLWDMTSCESQPTFRVYIASMFRVEDYAKQETSMKEEGNRSCWFFAFRTFRPWRWKRYVLRCLFGPWEIDMGGLQSLFGRRGNFFYPYRESNPSRRYSECAIFSPCSLWTGAKRSLFALE
jgi:hypothetical protein